MKRGLLLIAVALVLGGLLGTLVVRDPGYVLLAYGDYAVETSLWFAVALLILGYLAIRLLVVVVTRFARSGGRMGAWNEERRARGAQKQTVQGLLQLAEGDWGAAKKQLRGSAERAGAPLVNYLAAARAANELGQGEERDELLHLARQATPGSRLAVGLVQARLQCAARQWHQGLATLLELYREAPRQSQVLSLLAQCYENLNDWQALVELLPDLKKHKALPGPALAELERRAWRARLGSGGGDAAGLWQQLPADLKRDPALIGAYARLLMAQADQADAAEELVRKAVGRDWDETLVELYGHIVATDGKRQVAAAEGWLKDRPEDPVLLLALGRICHRNELADKAREYLQTSLGLRPSAGVYVELGALLSELGETERAAGYLRQAVAEAVREPVPAADQARGA